MQTLTKDTPNKRISGQSGFTLLEILVGISLGIIVLGGILSVYVPALKTWRTAAATSTLQDVQQLSYETLSRSIRQSGLLVCGANNALESTIASPLSSSISKWAFKFTQPFKAVAATDATEIGNSIEANGDINRARLRDDGTISNNASAADTVGDLFYTLLPGGESMRIVSNDNQSPSGKNMVLSNASGIEEGALYLIHDCSFPILIRAENGSTGNTLYYTNTSKHTGIDYPAGTIVTRFSPTLFYLGVLNGTPTLYKRTISKTLGAGVPLTHTTTPVLSGIENLRIEYGVDRPAAANSLAAASRVTNYYTIPQMETLKGSIPTIYDYALTARVSLMIRTDQENSNSLQKSLKFPALDGTWYDCYSASNSASACPDFLTNSRDRNHKVITFAVNLSTKYDVL